MDLPETQIPSCGRLIHTRYTYDEAGDNTQECRPALVMGIDHANKQLHLKVFTFRAPDVDTVINIDSPNWHWPERV